jgi:DNA-binding response OmpR family regulator
LLVEDDALLGDGIKRGLRHIGFTVDWIRDGKQGECALSGEDYAAAVLDVSLPRQDGLALLKSVRNRGLRTPILVLSMCDTKLDTLKVFDAGADDCIVKPVDMEELAARLRALIRRSTGHATPCIEVGAVKIDPASQQAWLDGERVKLSAREFAVLEMLMQNTGRVMSRAQLEQGLYGWDGNAESNTIEVFIHHLRRKLGSEFIRTLRGIGYIVGWVA